MRGIDVGDVAIDAKTLNGKDVSKFVVYDSHVDIIPDTINKMIGYGYVGGDYSFYAPGPFVGFGVEAYHTVINQPPLQNSRVRVYQTLNNVTQPQKELAWYDDVANLISLDDLKEVLSDEQIVKLSAKVEQRIALSNPNKETSNTNDMNISNLQMGGGIERFALADSPYVVTVRQKGGRHERGQHRQCEPAVCEKFHSWNIIRYRRYHRNGYTQDYHPSRCKRNGYSNSRGWNDNTNISIQSSVSSPVYFLSNESQNYSLQDKYYKWLERLGNKRTFQRLASRKEVVAQ